jgi:hypothetical protein
VERGMARRIASACSLTLASEMCGEPDGLRRHPLSSGRDRGVPEEHNATLEGPDIEELECRGGLDVLEQMLASP